MRNWRKFQHYGNRTPPWIKTYVGLLDDKGFNSLRPGVQLMLIKTWLLASKDGGRLELDLPWISRRINLEVAEGDVLEALDSGFLVPLNPAAEAWMRRPKTPTASGTLASVTSGTFAPQTDRQTDSLSVDRLGADLTGTAVSVVDRFLDDGPLALGRGGPGSATP